MTEDPHEHAVRTLREALRGTHRRNRIAAIVGDTCREQIERLSDEALSVDVAHAMLSGVLAALAGKTDWSDLVVIHPDLTPLAWARIQAVLGDGS